MTSNLKFYEKALSLRTKYAQEGNKQKIEILARIISIACEYWENLPNDFVLDFPGLTIFLVSFRVKEQIENVLKDLGYPDANVKYGHFYEGGTRFPVSLSKKN